MGHVNNNVSESVSKELNQTGNDNLNRKENERTYSFPLSNGMALLKLPITVSSKDIEILRKYIEILELEKG